MVDGRPLAAEEGDLLSRLRVSGKVFVGMEGSVDKSLDGAGRYALPAGSRWMLATEVRVCLGMADIPARGSVGMPASRVMRARGYR